ncbi:hypothetical protein BZK37_06780 [Enterococcus casseliflavus]|nr:hypothetical protein BZK37_06780 [Enterococcus casseliflavus]
MLKLKSHVQIIELRNGKKILANSITDKVYELNDISFDILTAIQTNSFLSSEQLLIYLDEKFNHNIDLKTLKSFLSLLTKKNALEVGTND